MAEITLIDYILLPFYLLFIFKIAYFYRDKYYPIGHKCRPYFITGLTAKIAGAVFIGLLYNYYYNGGDTFNFFYHSQIINSTFFRSPVTWSRLMTHSADGTDLIDAQALSQMYWYNDIPSYTTAVLGAVIGMFCFTKYLVINVVVAVISFTGIWLMFITFVNQYKALTLQIAVAVLFMPGPLVWSSGLFKDSFCMFAIGGLIYCTYLLFEQRTFKLIPVLLGATSIVLLLLIKAYILVIFLPLLLLKIIIVYKKNAASDPKRRVPLYAAILVLVVLGSIIVKKTADYLPAFTPENVLLTINKQKNYLLKVSIEQDGSGYDLGDFEPTLKGMSSKILPAINVTLFRPYPREAKSTIQLFTSLESTAVFLLTIWLILKRNIFKIIKDIYHDPNLIMCLLFTLIFAFFVGISSYNFGSLSRYKVPCTPFYMLFLMILLFKGKMEKTDVKPGDSDPDNDSDSLIFEGS